MSLLQGRGASAIRRSERGATLITFAISLVAICTVIALVIGGSLGYSAERNSQTASDVAALAATSALRAAQVKKPAPTLGDFATVLTTAESIAEANGSDDFDPADCSLVSNTLAIIDDCATASLADYILASGVRIDTSDTRDVPFGEVAGQTEITGATGAVATIQPVAAGRSPFMMCSPAPGHGPVKVLLPDDSINPLAAQLGIEYMLHGNAMKDDGRDCGNPASNWRGWVDFHNTFDLPGEWAIENGVGQGHIPRELAGDDACGGDAGAVDSGSFIGCVIAVPLCKSGNGKPGNNFRVNCVTYGAFEITHNGTGPSNCHSSPPKHMCGKFLGAAVARDGQGTDDKADVNEVVVIKLVA